MPTQRVLPVGLRPGFWEGNNQGMDLERLCRVVEQAGVVGAGGAGFPTHTKLSKPVKTVIVNGAECEPLLQVDIQLLEREGARLVSGLQAVVDGLGAVRGIVAVKTKHSRVIDLMRQWTSSDPRLSVHGLGDFYPVGDEQSLVYETLGRVVPEGGIPLAVSAVVLNVETLLNVEAALRNEPVVTTCVTVTGAVQHPGTFRVPVGTPVIELLRLAGGPAVERYRVLDGGPMTGILIPPGDSSLEVGVSKTTKGLIVLPADHPLVVRAETSMGDILRQAQSACCQCRICTDLCPRHLLGHSLEPSRVLNAVNHYLSWDSDAITQAFLCCECGVCDLYACPVGLSPRRMYQALKVELRRQGASNPHHNSPQVPRAERAGRRIPTARLLERLGLTEYDKQAPWNDDQVSVDRVRIAFRQHIGNKAEPLVKVGERVNVGCLIAAPKPGRLGAKVHASIAGVVEKVTEEFIEIGGPGL